MPISLFRRAPARPWTDLSPDAAARLAPTLRVIDVRGPDEFAGDLGHLAHAELVPLPTLASAARDWDPHAPLLLICRSGKRSETAAAQLAAAGFDALHNLQGGMLAWSARHLPTCRDAHRDGRCPREEV